MKNCEIKVLKSIAIRLIFLAILLVMTSEGSTNIWPVPSASNYVMSTQVLKFDTPNSGNWHLRENVVGPVSSAVYYSAVIEDQYVIYYRQNTDNSIPWAKYATADNTGTTSNIYSVQMYVNSDETKLVIVDEFLTSRGRIFVFDPADGTMLTQTRM